MTSGEFSEVDFDLLADYVGGALHGTPADETVAGLVAADPAWRAAHDELTAAIAQVGIGMRALAATDEPMPQDVATRLDAALSTAPMSASAPASDHRADPGTAPETTLGDTGPGRRHLSAVPGPVEAADDEPVPDPPAGARSAVGQRPRRWRPRPAVLAAAATVVAVATVGVGALRQADNGHFTGASTTAGRPPVVAPAREGDDAGAAKQQNAEKAAAGVAADRIVASGTGYRRGELADQVRGFPWAAKDAQVGPSPATTTGQAPVRPLGTRPVPAGLERLTVPAALRACLDAITAAHRRLISVVELVDYATLEGAPALVVSFTDAERARWVWVSGPACGDGAAGPDTLFVTQVG